MTIERNSRRATLAVAIIATGHLVLAWLLRIPALSWGEDDAAYIQLADQLRQFSYREIHDVAEPIHARFPPGFPLAIAALRMLFGTDIDVILFFVALCSAMTVVLVFDVVRRTFGDLTGVLSAALCAICPTMLLDASQIMAESLFKLFVFVALWALTREDEEGGTWFAVVGGAATIAAALTRSAGVVFLPALALHWALRRRWRHLAGFSVASLLVVAWLGWTYVAPQASSSRLYLAQMGLGEEAVAPADGFLAETLIRLTGRAFDLLSQLVPTALGLITIPGTRADNVGWVALLSGFGLTSLLVFWKRWRVASLFFIAYAALLLVYVHAVTRFVHPVIPLMLIAMLVGAAWWTRRLLGERWVPRVVGTVAALLAIGPVVRNVETVRAAAACDRRDPVGSKTCFNADDQAFLELARWVRDSTPSSAVFFLSKERAFYYHSGRRTLKADRGLREDSTSLGAYLQRQGATYAVVVRVGVYFPRHNDLVARACRAFDQVTSIEDRALLLRVRATPEPTTDTATCRALEAFRAPEPLGRWRRPAARLPWQRETGPTR